MSRPITIEIAHELGRAEALNRFQNGFGRIRDQLGSGMFSFQERWEKDVLHFSAGALGQSVGGRVTVMERAVRIELHLPALLAAMAEKLQRRVRSVGQLLLEKK